MSRKPRLTVIAPDPKVHHDRVLDLIAKVFSHSGYFNFLDGLRRYYVDHSHYDWSASRIGLLDGKVVTHYGVWDYQMRIGTARVRTGGIGVVATHGEYRKRGLMDRTARASVKAMRELGYDFSVLFGIDNFYHRFGYTRAWNEATHHVKTGDLPKENLGRPLRKFRFGPRADLERLFNRENATVTGSAVRPTYSRPNSRRKRLGYLWTGAGGGPAGYIAVGVRDNHLDVVEAVGDPTQVLRAVGQLARRFGVTDVHFECLPRATPLARRLRQGNCTVETWHRRCGAAMVRVINLAPALTKMAGELSRRLRASPLAGWRGELALVNSEETAVLTVAKGQVRVRPGAPGRFPKHAVRGGAEIAQLLLGTADPAEIVAAHGTRLSGDARKLLPVLFPNQDPMLHAADRY